jgi:hypothetical protein
VDWALLCALVMLSNHCTASRTYFPACCLSSPFRKFCIWLALAHAWCRRCKMRLLDLVARLLLV